MRTRIGRVVQFATAVAYDSDSDDVIERLYALDSNGVIWWWRYENARFTSGWVQHEDIVSVEKKK